MIIKRFWKSVKKLGEVTNEVASAMDSAFNLGYPTCASLKSARLSIILSVIGYAMKLMKRIVRSCR